MKTNVKPGDLAIVTGAFFCTENIGRIVEVVRPAVPGVDVGARCTHQGPSWMVRSQTPLGRVAGGYTRRIKPSTEAPCADCYLRPISGLPLEEETKEPIHEGT
jgi:hypothetical protein